MPALSRRTERTVIRTVHLVVGALLGTYVYLPTQYEAAHDVLRWTLTLVGLPVIVISGLWLWKDPAIRRRLGWTASGPEAS